MEKKKQITIVYKMKREDIMTFVSGLHEIQMEMMKGDYEHLVNTFDKHFGEFVTLYR
mgnify:CR=1 FL=1